MMNMQAGRSYMELSNSSPIYSSETHQSSMCVTGKNNLDNSCFWSIPKQHVISRIYSFLAEYRIPNNNRELILSALELENRIKRKSISMANQFHGIESRLFLTCLYFYDVKRPSADVACIPLTFVVVRGRVLYWK